VFFDRFSGEQQQAALATESEPVQIMAVPRENSPATFNGAVGNYSLNVNAGPTNLTEGDPITVKIQIAGRGSIENLTLPDISWPNFITHPPDIKTETSDQFGFQGTKTFEYIATPQSPDIKALPAVSFSFFDPDQKIFRTLTQPPIPLVVRPGGAAAVPAAYAAARPKQDSPPPAQDIVPNKQRLGTLGQINAPLVQQTWFLALQGVPVLALVSSVAWRRRAEKLANNPRLRRQRHVAQTVRDGLAELRRFAGQNKSDEFFATIFRLLQEQLGERLDLPATAITEAVIEERLRPRGVPEALLNPLHELFQMCNLARYAPVKNPQALNELVPKVEAVLTQAGGLRL
jgi:hypothetical protein